MAIIATITQDVARTGDVTRHGCFSEKETLQIGLILFPENLGESKRYTSEKIGLASAIP
jgi:hypothetical protein